MRVCFMCTTEASCQFSAHILCPDRKTTSHNNGSFRKPDGFLTKEKAKKKKKKVLYPRSFIKRKRKFPGLLHKVV